MSDNNQTNGKAITHYVELKQLALGDQATIQRFADALGGNEKRARVFLSNVLTVVSGSQALQRCRPEAILNECMKLAVMDLPINEALGLACIVPYAGAPKHQIMKNGYLQLAHRTRQYAKLNTDAVYANQTVVKDHRTGDIQIIGEPDRSQPVTHYFNYFRKLNGFEHTLCWTVEECIAWGKRYNPKAFDNPDSLWKKNPEAMYKAKVTKLNLKWYGELSIAVEDDDEYLDPATMDTDASLMPIEPHPEFDIPLEDPRGAEVLEGQFTEPEPTPEPAPVQPPAPQKSAAKPRGAKPEDERIAALLAANIVPNAEIAEWVLAKINIAASVPVEEVVKMVRGFYGWKDKTGASDDQAIKMLLKGEYPK